MTALIEKMKGLSPDQGDRFINFCEISIATKEGRKTDTDLMNCIRALPMEDVKIFTEILEDIKKIRREGKCLNYQI